MKIKNKGQSQCHMHMSMQDIGFSTEFGLQNLECRRRLQTSGTIINHTCGQTLGSQMLLSDFRTFVISNNENKTHKERKLAMYEKNTKY